jgi:hypothetical protein
MRKFILSIFLSAVGLLATIAPTAASTIGPTP